MTTLIVPNVVRVSEDVQDKIYRFAPTDTPLISGIGRRKVSNVFHEWQRKGYRSANPDNAAIEGADATYAAQTQPGMLSNRTQIVQDTLQVSNTVEAVKKYGRSSEIKELKAEKMVELKKDIEAAAIARGTAVTGTSGVAGQMRGLYGFCTQGSFGATGAAPDPTTNTAPTAGTLRPFTEALLKDGIQDCYTNGGKASVVLVTPAHKVQVSTFTGNVQRTNEVGTKQAAVLNAAFDVYRSDFGLHKIVPSRTMSGSAPGLVNTAYLIDYDKMELGQLRGFESEEMARTGDSRKWQIRTEVTLVVHDEKPLAAIRDLTLTGA